MFLKFFVESWHFETIMSVCVSTVDVCKPFVILLLKNRKQGGKACCQAIVLL